MASTAHIVYCVRDGADLDGNKFTNNTAITVSGSSQTSSATCPYSSELAATGRRALAWVYIDGDTDVWVTIGASPTASNGSGMLQPAGTACFYTCHYGDSVAVINAS